MENKMKVFFDKNDVKVNGESIFTYEELSKDDGYTKIYSLLSKCVKFEGLIDFDESAECAPFGQKLKSIISSEFSVNEE